MGRLARVRHALLREPLVHFVVIGGMLFAIQSGLETRRSAGVSPAIRITASDVDWLRQMSERQWGRAPTDEELTSLVADHLKDEVLAREARAQQLDVGDTVVRRRLAQKMAFLLEDTVRTAEPPETELRALYGARPDLGAMPAKVSFEHVFFTTQNGDKSAARMAFAALSVDPDTPVYGERFLLGEAFADQDQPSLTNLFGQSFAQAVFTMEPGRWSGPIVSVYGVHLVKVTDVRRSSRRRFDEVRDRVAQEWHRQRQESAKERLYAGLLRKYSIVADPSVSPLLRPLLAREETKR